MSVHDVALQSSCRVCGNKLQHKWRSLKKTFPSSLPIYPVLGLENELFDCFGVVSFDDSKDIHPSSMCFPCKNTLKNWRKKDKNYIHSIIPAGWSAHSEKNCMVCTRFEETQKPGRPNKSKSNRGRPLKSKNSQDSQTSTSYYNEIVESIIQCAGTDFIGEILITEEQINTVTDNLKCPICKTILNRAVITCTQEHMACAPCLTKAVQMLPVCPICRDNLNIQPLGRFASNTLAETTISCNSCKQDTVLERLRIHSDNCITVHNSRNTIPPQLNPTISPTTATRVLLNAQDLTDVRDRSELECLTTKLVKRKMNDAVGEPVTFQTGGRPLVLTKVTKPQKTSDAQVSTSTLKRRSQETHNLRLMISGSEEGARVQQIRELKGLPKNEVQNLLKEAGVYHDVDPRLALAFKSSQNVSWSKLRSYRRWFMDWGIKLSSEKEMRKLDGKDQIGIQIKADLIPFSFPIKKGTTVKMAPYVCTLDLVSHIYLQLETLQREYQLTWQNGKLPADEIWVKLGGDKGGGSTKFAFQILNVDHPNSATNTTVFAAFVAPDTAANIRTAMTPFRDQLEDLYV